MVKQIVSDIGQERQIRLHRKLSLWTVDWKDKAYRSLEFRVAALLGLGSPYSGLQPMWYRSCSGPRSPVLESCPWENLCLWAWVSQVSSPIVHPPSSFSSSSFKEQQLVIRVLSLQLCDSAAHSHWGGHPQDWERCTALNWVSCTENLLQLLCCSTVYILLTTVD